MMAIKCPICSSSAHYVFKSKHNKNIYVCESNLCGHFYTPVISLDQGVCERAPDIESESNISLSIFEKRNHRLIQLFNREILGFDSKKILDFGAGDAHISRTFKSLVGERATIYCLEPNPLCKGFYERFGLVQVTEIDSLNDTIDLIYMVEVVEHLTDPIFELSKIRKKISSTGTLFISTPLGQMNESETNAYDTESHLHFFTPKSLNLALTKAGFSSIDYVRVPEIYPTVWDRGILRGLAVSVRNLFRVQKNYGHLVGFSYPI